MDCISLGTSATHRAEPGITPGPLAPAELNFGLPEPATP